MSEIEFIEHKNRCPNCGSLKCKLLHKAVPSSYQCMACGICFSITTQGKIKLLLPLLATCQICAQEAKKFLEVDTSDFSMDTDILLIEKMICKECLDYKEVSMDNFLCPECNSKGEIISHMFLGNLRILGDFPILNLGTSLNFIRLYVKLFRCKVCRVLFGVFEDRTHDLRAELHKEIPIIRKISIKDPQLIFELTSRSKEENICPACGMLATPFPLFTGCDYSWKYFYCECGIRYKVKKQRYLVKAGVLVEKCKWCGYEDIILEESHEYRQLKCPICKNDFRRRYRKDAQIIRIGQKSIPEDECLHCAGGLILRNSIELPPHFKGKENFLIVKRKAFILECKQCENMEYILKEEFLDASGQLVEKTVKERFIIEKEEAIVVESEIKNLQSPSCYECGASLSGIVSFFYAIKPEKINYHGYRAIKNSEFYVRDLIVISRCPDCKTNYFVFLKDYLIPFESRKYPKRFICNIEKISKGLYFKTILKAIANRFIWGKPVISDREYWTKFIETQLSQRIYTLKGTVSLTDTLKYLEESLHTD